MKTNQKTEPTTSEWDHVRILQGQMRGHARDLPTARILFGKAVFELREARGIQGRGGDRRSKMHSASLKTEEATWKAVCKRELQINQTTADRYVRRFQTALECAEDMHPSILAILRKPSAAITDEDFATLAESVDGLVDRMTQTSLQIELGITQEADDLEEEEDDHDPNTAEADFQALLEQQAIVFFASIPRKIDKLKKEIRALGDFGTYHTFLHHLPLEDGRDGKPSLMGIKEGLEEILSTGLMDILKEISDTAKTRMHGDPVKVSRRKLTTKSRK